MTDLNSPYEPPDSERPIQFKVEGRAEMVAGYCCFETQRYRHLTDPCSYSCVEGWREVPAEKEA